MLLLLTRHGRIRRALTIAIMVVVALVLAPAFGLVASADPPLISCQTCYDQYPDWWCHYVWQCPWPAGGGGGSGADVVAH